MSENQIFVLTKNIIQECEKSLLESFKFIHKSFDQDFRLPIGYMLIGFKELFKAFKKFIKTLFFVIIGIYISSFFMILL